MLSVAMAAIAVGVMIGICLDMNNVTNDASVYWFLGCLTGIAAGVAL